jgi:hypothetical protein
VPKHHHPGDIIFGATIGLIAGSLAYRSSYASLFDFRYNHIPLPPGSVQMRFSYSSSYDLDGSNITETGLEFADNLVILDWWGATRLHAHRSDRRWVRSLISLKATGEEMGRPSYCIPLHNSPGNALGPSLGESQEPSPASTAPSTCINPIITNSLFSC